MEFVAIADSILRRLGRKVNGRGLVMPFRKWAAHLRSIAPPRNVPEPRAGLASLQHDQFKEDFALLLSKGLQLSDYLPYVILACPANGVAVEPAVSNLLGQAVMFVQCIQCRQYGLQIVFIQHYTHFWAKFCAIYMCAVDMPSRMAVQESVRPLPRLDFLQRVDEVHYHLPVGLPQMRP